MSDTQFKTLTKILQEITKTALENLTAKFKGQGDAIAKAEGDILGLKAAVTSLEDAIAQKSGSSSGLQALQVVAQKDDDDNDRESPEIISVGFTQDPNAEESDDDAPTPAPTTTTTVKKSAKPIGSSSSNGGSKWISRRFSTPDNTQKVLIAKTKDPRLHMEIHTIGKEKFVSVSPKKGYDGKFPKECYLYSMDETKITTDPVMSINQLNGKLKRMAKDGCTLYLQRFNNAQLRAINKKRDKKTAELRASLWEKYETLFSTEYRDDNRAKHFRYRPDCLSCSGTRSCEVLDQLITERCALIAEKMDIEDERHAIFKKFKEADDDEWEKWMKLVEDRDESSDDDSDAEIMSYKAPKDFKESTRKKRKHALFESDGASSKKQKMSLREEFIAAGHDAAIFDSLRGKMSEEQLRGFYKF
jgi:hypothetical protein